MRSVGRAEEDMMEEASAEENSWVGWDRRNRRTSSAPSRQSEERAQKSKRTRSLKTLPLHFFSSSSLPSSSRRFCSLRHSRSSFSSLSFSRASLASSSSRFAWSEMKAALAAR